MAWTNESEGKLGDSYLTKEQDNDYILQENGDKIVLEVTFNYTYESEG